MVRKTELTGAFVDIVGPAIKKPKKEKNTPLSVLLAPEEKQRIKAIAEELGHPIHAVLRYAVRSFIRRYDEGERPGTMTKTVTLLDPST